MAHVRQSGRIDRAERVDRELHAGHREPAYALAAIDPADETAAARPARRGAGTRCEYCRTREATRFPGAWRCGQCPDPAQPAIAAEVDRPYGDPAKRWRWATTRGQTTSRHDRYLSERKETA